MLPLSDTDMKEVRRMRRADPRLASAIDKRFEHWPDTMRAAMLLAIVQAERAIEQHHYAESQRG